MLEDEVNAEIGPLRRIIAVARRSSCPVFGDILWLPTPDLLVLMGDPGVMFESPRRLVVFQRIGGELRYYAGGWCLDQNRIYLEQDRIESEGCELGVFGSVGDALAFAYQYLAEEKEFGAVLVPRFVRYSHDPEAKDGERDAPPGRPRD
jgi:hypothetical protein